MDIEKCTTVPPHQLLGIANQQTDAKYQLIDQLKKISNTAAILNAKSGQNLNPLRVRVCLMD